MKITITCFKRSGKYYAEHEADIPEGVVELIKLGNGERLIYLPDLLDYIRTHPETWPVTGLSEFDTLITKPDESDGICIVPHILHN